MSLPPVPPLQFEGRCPTLPQLDRWIARLEIYFQVAQVKDPNLKLATFLHLGGESIIDLYQENIHDKLDHESKDTYKEMLQALRDMINAATNMDYERYLFRECKQMEMQIMPWYQKLRRLAQTCNFTNAEDEIRSQVILGTSNNHIRKKGLMTQCTLQELLQFGHSAETVDQQIHKMQASQPVCQVQAPMSSCFWCGGKLRNT